MEDTQAATHPPGNADLKRKAEEDPFLPPASPSKKPRPLADHASSPPPPADHDKLPDTEAHDAPSAAPDPEPQAPLSKSQQKKLRRRQLWEDGRDARKAKRKEKTKERKERRRAARDDPNAPKPEAERPARRSVLVPVTFLIDCSFDRYMHETEMTSMGSQLTRAYSDNRRAAFRAHLVVSGFEGALKERFEGVLKGVYRNWTGVRFRGEAVEEVAEMARGWMREKGNRLAGALKKDEVLEAAEKGVKNGDEKTAEAAVENGADNFDEEQAAEKGSNGTARNGAAPAASSHPGPEGEIVYLTSDSPNTLEELKPYSTYIIGGIVDKNRHKGLCYKIAQQKGIKTAKLPISDYLKMQSRTVLTTNHVNEIMLRWLESGDWGQAFMAVIPKRKDASLKEKENAAEKDDDEALDEAEDAAQEASDAEEEQEAASSDADSAQGAIAVADEVDEQ